MYYSWFIDAKIRSFNSLRRRKLTVIGSDDGLSPRRRQAIIWTNAGILLIRPLGKKQWILIEKEKAFEMFVAKWRPFCLGVNVLNHGEVAKCPAGRCILWWVSPTSAAWKLAPGDCTSEYWHCLRDVLGVNPAKHIKYGWRNVKLNFCSGHLKVRSWR